MTAPRAERTDVHYAFLSGAVRVVVATVAFGMGCVAAMPLYGGCATETRR